MAENPSRDLFNTDIFHEGKSFIINKGIVLDKVANLKIFSRFFCDHVFWFCCLKSKGWSFPGNAKNYRIFCTISNAMQSHLPAAHI